MARDYASEGIRVNAVLPGFTATPLNRSVLDDPERLDRIVSMIPLGRPGQAEEVARVILFLASDEASYVTGAAWCVDGGLTAVLTRSRIRRHPTSDRRQGRPGTSLSATRRSDRRIPRRDDARARRLASRRPGASAARADHGLPSPGNQGQSRDRR
jgi:hypothetical protein